MDCDSGSALVLLWLCSGSALVLLWLCSGSALALAIRDRRGHDPVDGRRKRHWAPRAGVGLGDLACVHCHRQGQAQIGTSCRRRRAHA
ncbi:hypothetical protein V8E51_003773 [Hyaloscypha variabilis]